MYCISIKAISKKRTHFSRNNLHFEAILGLRTGCLFAWETAGVGIRGRWQCPDRQQSRYDHIAFLISANYSRAARRDWFHQCVGGAPAVGGWLSISSWILLSTLGLYGSPH